MKKLLPILFFVSLSGCFLIEPQTKDIGSSSVSEIHQMKQGDKTSGAFDSSSKDKQLLKASDESAISGSSVMLPPGALSVSTSISMEEGASLASDSVAEDLSLGKDAFESVGPAVVIEPAQDITLSKPMVIAIPAPKGSSLLKENNLENLVVIYKSKDKLGIITADKLSIKDDVVELSTTDFGSFQAVITTSKIEEEKEVSNNEPIVTKTEEQQKSQEEALKKAQEIEAQTPALEDHEEIILTATVTMNDISFANEGGDVASCSSEPLLPSGLTLRVLSGTCVISGTPSTSTNEINYTITGLSEAGHEGSAKITITVNIENPPLIDDIGLYKFNMTVPTIPVSLSNTGAPAIGCTISPALPTGLTISPKSDTCEITGTPSVSSDEAQYTITATAADGSQDSALINLWVKGAFITKWDTNITGTTGNTQILLPLKNGGNYSFTVDWGDGTTDTITSEEDIEKTHTYGSSGIYTVTITGIIEGWDFSQGSMDNTKLTEVVQWGSLNLGNAGYYFKNASNMTVTATDRLDISNTTNMVGAFEGCSSLDQIPSINDWDFSSVTTMEKMFNNSGNFNQDLEGLDVSQVTNMHRLFAAAASFNGKISTWDVSSATNMSMMFYSATSFNQNITSWDVGQVTDMSQMFNYASAFNQNIGSWNVGGVTTFVSMFNGASNFNQNIGSWDTSNATTMNSMFNTATNFNHDIGSWDTSSLTTAAYMFSNASSFDQNIGGWDVSAVSTMSNMLDNSGISSGTMDQIITGWAAQSVLTSVVVGCLNLSRTSASNTDYTTLTSGSSWLFTSLGGP